MTGTLPQSWKRTKLVEVCLPVDTIRPADSPDELFTYFDISSIDNQRNTIVEAKILAGREAPSRARQAVRKGDILFSNVRTYLRNIARIERDYANPVASTGFTVIRPASGVSSDFLYYQILTDEFLQPLDKLQSGTSYPAIREREVLNRPVVVPPWQEQERIARKLKAALSAINRGKIKTQRAQEQLLKYRELILREAVTGKLTNEWRRTHSKKKSESGSEVLKRLLEIRRLQWERAHAIFNQDKSSKASPRGPRYSEPVAADTTNTPKLPKQWVMASLDMVAEIGSGIAVSQNRRIHDPIDIPYLRVANVMRGYLDLREIRTLRFEKKRVSDYLLQVGDVLFNEGGDRDKVGRGWIWEGQLAKCVHQNHVFRARLFDQSLLEPRLVSHWGNTFGQQFFLRHAKQTTNLASISQSALKRLPVPIPPIREQSKIITELHKRTEAANRLAITLEDQLQRAEISRQSLLRDAFAGKLVGQEPDDESVLDLLSRVRQQKLDVEAEHESNRRNTRMSQRKKRAAMKKEKSLSESLMAAWNKLGGRADARRLFLEAGLGPDDVVRFYETIRLLPEILEGFQKVVPKDVKARKPVRATKKLSSKSEGGFRLDALWLEDFKNLKDYSVRFDPHEGLDVVLGWNGTGKSNLFEALVIIFRELHEWCMKNRWSEGVMNGFRISYEIGQYHMQVTWIPGKMKRPELTRRSTRHTGKSESRVVTISREQLLLPRFVFAYYSGPTNRLCEHFLPMKQAHYDRLRLARADDAKTLAELLEQRRFFCAETHHAKYVLLAFSYKEDPKIDQFLRDRLRIVGFESALFIIRRPRWAKPGAKAENFWGATGIMRRVMERLRRHAIAPMVLKQKVSYGYRTTTEDHYYFFLPDLESLHAFAAEYENARTFFLALESTDFSELIYDVKIQVRVRAADSEQVAITFHQLSEGEQQLLMVLGLMRFTKSHESLVLLDEPDTHLNPHWSIGYLKDLTYVMSDNSGESSEQQTSQILMASHDPLVIASLVKEQVHLLKRDPNGACKWVPAPVNPRGLGFTGILTSEMFGFRSDLDPETLSDLDNRVRLVAKESSLTNEQRERLAKIDHRLAQTGFAKAFSDPYYAAFVRAWGKRHSELMAGQQFVTEEQKREIDRVASEVLKEAVEEVEKEVVN